jgi:hypothetical protein
MFKRFLFLSLSIILIFSLALPVFAKPKGTGQSSYCPGQVIVSDSIKNSRTFYRCLDPEGIWLWTSICIGTVVVEPFGDGYLATCLKK